MDDGAVSLYQQEMARRGLTLPKKQPTPREAVAGPVATPRPTVREKPDPTIRALECAKWYVANPDLTLDDIARMSREKWGLYGYRTASGVSKALEGLGVKRRARLSTVELSMRKMQEKVTRLTRYNRSLIARNNHLRRQVAALEGAA